MSLNVHGPVVVGVDFSKDNVAAIEYATAVATRRQVPLHLIYAIDPHGAPQTYLALTEGEIREEAEGELADQASALREEHPGLEVTTEFVPQAATSALVRASERASVVVVGSRGHGGFGQLLLGSVAWRVASRAYGAVLLVRPNELMGRVASGPVLVGVDGSESSRVAVEFAFEEARSRGTHLIAANIWALPEADGLAVERDWPTDPGDAMRLLEQDADRVLSEMLAGYGERYPEVAVTKVAAHGFNIPLGLLELASAHDADLIVVGAQGTHAVAELVLGAVGVQLSHHADRTIAVVHAARE